MTKAVVNFVPQRNRQDPAYIGVAAILAVPENAKGEGQFQEAAESLAAELCKQAPGGFVDALCAELVRQKWFVEAGVR